MLESKLLRRIFGSKRNKKQKDNEKDIQACFKYVHFRKCTEHSSQYASKGPLGRSAHS
jgi:hypothetical protein